MQHSFLDPIDIFREHRDDARILVSANFRVGILGFLSSEDLMWDGLDMSTRVSDSAGNFGLWDLRLALQWTYDHIHLFGGDASNISAGGAGYVTALQLHYDAFQAPDERIIRRAFLFSGAVGIQPEQANSAKPGRQFAELCSQLGVGDDLTPQAKMRLLRAVPATRLLEVARLLETEYCPVTDGKGGFVPTWLMASIWNGELGRRLKQRNVQVVIGDTADERSFYEYCGQNPGSRHRMPRAISTRDGTLAKLKAFFPEDMCQALVVRYAREITDWNSVYCDIMADLQCHAVVRGFAQCLFYGGMTTQDVFRYHIAWRAKSFEAWIDPGLGVSHVVEMPVWWYAGWLAGFARKDKQDILQFAAPFARFLHGDSSLHIHWGTEAEFEVRALGDDGAVMCMEDSMWMKKIGVWNTIRDVQRERYEKKGG
jgi:carboxylesterase type B